MNALIITGGRLPDDEELCILAKAAQCMICADSGADAAVRLGLNIDIAIGDMDSLLPDTKMALRRMAIPTREYPREKDETDTQLAVDYAIENGASHIVIAGGLGSRLDHGLGNLLLLIRMARRGITGWLTDGNCRVQVTDHAVTLIGQPGDLVSLVPFGAGVMVQSLTGLQYPLLDFELPIDTPIGISNVFTGQEANIDIAGGYCFIIRPYAAD